MLALVGQVLVVCGAWLMIRCTLLVLGRGRPRRGLQPAFVIAGPYRRVRNPLFGGAALVLGGWAMLSPGWMSAAFVSLLLVALHLWVVGVEEPRLRRRFGPAYAEYLLRVPRWIPYSKNSAGRGES